MTLLFLVSCARGTAPAMDKVKARVPQKFSLSGGAIKLNQRWWLHFNDSQLNALIATALARNPSVRATYARLLVAVAQAKKLGATRFPTLALSGSANGGYGYNFGAGKGASIQGFSLSLAASYEVDLWGRRRSELQAIEYDTLASHAALLTSALTLSGEVVSSYYTMVELSARIGLLNNQVTLNERYLKSQKIRFANGQGSLADILQQTRAVESIRATIIKSNQELAVERSKLALLLGKYPSDLKITLPGKLAPLVPLPAVGLPLDLIKRRPDVASAFLAVKAANARVAAAIADQLPKLSLSLGVSTTDQAFRDMFKSWLVNLALNLTAPLWKGGELKAEVERTRAVFLEKVALYQETVLKAVSDVETWLLREKVQRNYLKSLEKQISLSRKYLKDMEFRYLQGTSELSFSIYLIAKVAYHDLELSYLSAQGAMLQLRIGLLRSLAGSWKMTPKEMGELSKGD
ncbi:TolC family protein [Myxococcota bacterium]|nr:TolC family protein [Myxococcota bacterium]